MDATIKGYHCNENQDEFKPKWQGKRASCVQAFLIFRLSEGKKKRKERKGKRQIIKWDTEDEKLGRKGEKSITNVNGETSDM